MGSRLLWQRLLTRALAVCLLTAMLGAFGAAYAKSVLIVAIGADNVHGRGIGHRRTGGVPVSEAFPAQLQALLRARGSTPKSSMPASVETQAPECWPDSIRPYRRAHNLSFWIAPTGTIRERG